MIQQLLAMLGGVSATLLISIFSFFLGLAIGLVLAFMKAYGSKPAQILIDIFEKIFRGIPELVLMLLFYFGIGFGLGYQFPNPFRNAFFTATFVLGLRSAANQSQIFKGALRGLGEEQMVVARSLGLSKLQSVIHVMIPQVFIFSAPGLGSEYALLVKDSSYAFIIGVVEMMAITDWIRKGTGDTVTPYLLAAFLYILLTFPIATWLDMWGSRRKKQLGL